MAGTYDGSDVRLFVDGSEVGTPNTGPAAIAYGAAVFSGDLSIGSYGDIFSPVTDWRGDIDEVRIWSRALSLTEIAASAHMGLGGSYANQIKEKHYTSDFVVFTSHHTSASTVHISIVSDVQATKITGAIVKSTRPKKTATACTISQTLHNGDKSLDVELDDCIGTATSVRLRVSLDSGDAFSVNVALP